VVAGAAPPAPTGTADLAGLVAEEERRGTSLKEAIGEVARRTGMPKRTVYAAAHGLEEG
jgi:16S rRNA (cytidine1402-2'-O)-methyltransferase